MNEPVSNAEVEDVLASIRRLVSEERRPPMNGAGETRAPTPTEMEPSEDFEDEAPQAEAAPPADENRLVLAPSFRVMDKIPEDWEQDAQAERDEAEEPDSADLTASEVMPHESAEDAEDSGAVFDHDAEVEAEGAEDELALSEPDVEDHASDVEVMSDDAVAFEVAMEAVEAHENQECNETPDNVGFVEPVDTAAHDAPPLTEVSQDTPQLDDDSIDDDTAQEDTPADLSEDQPLVLATESDVESLEDESNPEAVPSAAVAEDDVSDAQPDHADEVEDDTSEDAPVSSEAALKGAALGAKIAALEAVIAGRADDEWEADGGDAEATPEAPEPFEWRHREIDATPAAAEAPLVFNPRARDESERPEPETEAKPETAVLVPETELFDEEALRDMVAEIVRQELQGALGERITRNVRKLVRREIQRAMATRDLE